MRKAQVEFPIKHIEGNIVFGQDGQVWAYYELEGYDYAFRSIQEKKKLRQQWMFLFKRVNLDYHLLQLPYDTDIMVHHNQLKNKVPAYLKEKAVSYLDQAIQALEQEIQEPTNLRTFLGLKLKKMQPRSVITKKNNRFSYKLKDFQRYLESLTGIYPEDILEEELYGYQDQAHTLYQELQSFFHAKPVATQDIQWIIRQAVYRGIKEAPLRSHWQPSKHKIDLQGKSVIRPHSINILTLASGMFEICPYHIKISQWIEEANQVRTGYVAFLYVTQLPSEVPFPNGEWVYLAQSLPFPVEISTRISMISNDKALDTMNRRKLRIQNQVAHTRTDGQQIDAYLEDNYHLAVQKEKEIREGAYPVLKSSTVFGVSAPTEELLNERVSQLISFYQTKSIELQVTTGDQFLAFNEFLPAGARYVSDFVHYIEPQMQASSMFGATQTLGDAVGFYLGKTGGNQNRLVFLEPSLAAKGVGKTNSLSMIFCGETGFGKSQSMDLLIYLSVLLRGAKALIIDPKGERTHWGTALPFLKDHTHVVTLGSDLQDTGKLDPFVMFENPNDAALYAKHFLVELTAVNRKDPWYNVIHEAVQEVRKSSVSKRSMQQVLHWIKKGNQELYRNIELYVDFPFSHLVFGDGKVKRGLDLQAPLNVLQIQDLKVPKRHQNPDYYSEIELLSKALLLPITGYTAKLMQQDRSILKLIAWDESWMTLESDLGEDTINSCIREGRYFKSGMLLATQNPTDLRGELVNNVGMRFMFKMEDPVQIKRALEILKLEDTETNRQMIQQLTHGECLCRDIYGRVGKLYFDPLFEEIAEAFNTTPPDQLEK